MRGYYVTLKRDRRTAWLLGPFAEHEKALAAVDVAWMKACKLDPWASFDAVGTSSIENETGLPPGVLNKHMPELLQEG